MAETPHDYDAAAAWAESAADELLTTLDLHAGTDQHGRLVTALREAYRQGWHAARHQPTETMAAAAPQPDPADTRRALEVALHEHGAVQGDGMVTDWVMTAAVASRQDPNTTVYVTETSDGPPHHRLGLVLRLMRRVEAIDAAGEDGAGG